MKADRNSQAQAPITRYENSLPKCEPIDCSKRKWAHLKQTRSFVSMNAPCVQRGK